MEIIEALGELVRDISEAFKKGFYEEETIEDDNKIKKITKRTNKVLKRELIYKINELTDVLNELKKGK